MALLLPLEEAPPPFPDPPDDDPPPLPERPSPRPPWVGNPVALATLRAPATLDNVPAVPEDVPLALATEAVPVFTTAPIPEFDPLWLRGTDAVAVTPLVIAPGPLTVPAVAAPPAAALLVAVPVGLVLVRVPVSAPVPVGTAGAAEAGTGLASSFGKFTKPLPTWPAPPEPGVGPPTASAPVAAACCARAGNAASSPIAASTRIAFILVQHRAARRVPDAGWPR